MLYSFQPLPVLVRKLDHMHSSIDSQPKLIILNDTDVGGMHFGCSRVMGNIKRLSEQYGLRILTTIPAATPSSSSSMRRAISETDIVMINGEGTLHHGRRRARWLIEAVEYAKSKNKPVALVNALYQENPELWNPVVRELDIIYARDALSATQLARAAGRSVEYMGDLALYDETPSFVDADRNGMLFGDSVHIRTTRRLLATASHISRHAPAQVMPITRCYPRSGSRRAAVSGLQTIYAYYCHRRVARFGRIVSFSHSQHSYMEALRRFALSVTGRFHALCFALLTGTPFVALASNSWKMEAIITDAGLRRDRLIGPRMLNPEIILDNDWSYSPEERESIDRYIEGSRAKARTLFHSLHSLVGSTPACEI